jgi:hypothetical protein
MMIVVVQLMRHETCDKISGKTWDPEDPGEESLERDLLFRDSRPEW